VRCRSEDEIRADLAEQLTQIVRDFESKVAKADSQDQEAAQYFANWPMIESQL
jgi:hypothetical protein